MEEPAATGHVLTVLMFIIEAMSAYELEKIDMSREIKRLPIEHLKNIGKVSARTPPPCQPFTGQEPYALDPTSFFEAADDVVAATPIGGEIHFDLIVEPKEQ
jgi:hypothetical protein